MSFIANNSFYLSKKVRLVLKEHLSSGKKVEREMEYAEIYVLIFN